MAAVARAEEVCRKLETERDKLDERLAEARKRVSGLKRELAGLLRGLLPELEGTGESQGEVRKRVKGVTAAILELLSDKRPRSPVEIAAELAKKGLPTRSATAAISVLFRQGKLARPSRGLYAQASDA